ncbi:hypothetical protein F8M41_019063 [Gigaspora margarita]|uniref:Uncharacterized protein n=1 Tax=Gigaspora margarita TaxID=4874 RepID=A0A8H4AKK2_GIGMA|nr:hypothetical protein F8M41_019063 [Gigaspora margarita]
MSPKSQKRKDSSEQNETSEIDSILDALKSGTSASTMKKSNVIDVDEDVTTESPQRSPLNEIFINMPEKSSGFAKCALSNKSDSVYCLLDITKKVLEQNTSIMEKQNALEGILTQLTESIKTLRSSCKNLKSKAKGNDASKWEALFSKIENLISMESCKYHGALFGSFRRLAFEYVFKTKISPTVNSESSEAEIASWKLNKEVQ